MEYNPATTPSEGRASTHSSSITQHTLQGTISVAVMDHALFTSGSEIQSELRSTEEKLELVRGVIGIFIDQPGCFRLSVTSISAESLVDKVIVACNIVMVMLKNYYTAQKTILRRKR
jgi:hypothetical protein